MRILRKLEFIRLSDHLVEQYKKTQNIILFQF